MAKDLESAAADAVYEAAYGMTELDLDKLGEEARERVHIEADNAVIYNSDALAIINEYEGHPAARVAEEEADDFGEVFKASDWQKAQTTYAYLIARAVIGACVEEQLMDITAKAEHLLDVLGSLQRYSRAVLPSDERELTVSRDCPHGWAAHDREDDEGTYFWTSEQVDGCNAVAIQTESGLWLSYTWQASDKATRAA
ncbi:hypothetical protein [Telmatospirillum sp. J64-1]|uniref:hypothetical protein n=1 Tax=Telmatospirillum sp. J64-1 TaxID=2502183 RepID=UPI00115DE433|nr:hypothetical protein [Telmatospirillum sp. J64-1]